MKKFNVKSFLAGVVVSAIVMSTVTALAEPVKMTIEVIFGQVNLVVDGKQVEKETLLYNGTTYVPLRSAAEVLGKEVGWDEATRTAYLGQVPAQNAPAAEQPAASQADLEKEYMKFMIDIYYDIEEANEALLAEVEKMTADPALITDKNWIAGFKKTTSDYTAKLSKLTSYDKNKIPEAYKNFHNAFSSGCENFKTGMEKLIYGIENEDVDSIMTALEYLDKATSDLDTASKLAPSFE